MKENNYIVGDFCHNLAKELYPICRSLTGPGVRESLSIIKQHIPALNIKQVQSGVKAFDWEVPNEWAIHDAYICDENGNHIIDFKDNNLHVVGYSEPVDLWLTREELEKHLYSLPEQPDAIPYVTSYYNKKWGFCLSQNQRNRLNNGRYRVVIRSELKPGVLNYAEIIIPGISKQEIFLSTYICHPSMANNELSGPVVTTALARWISSLENRYFSYRIVFIPETIGSIVYLSQHIDEMKSNIIAGFNITCIGDERCYSFLPSRNGKSLSDQAAKHVLKYIAPNYKSYSWLDRGSDERQYCAPGVDLPIATIMRSKYGEYPEYHTSLDDLKLVTPSGLEGGYNAIKQAIETIEHNLYLKVNVLGEPQLGKRGLYPNTSSKGSGDSVRIMMNLISYCDGEKTLLDIADLINQPFAVLKEVLVPLIDNGLISTSRKPF